MTDTFETIVVGGGIAGMTAAAYLARAGQKVLLIEKNREPGGLVSSFSRDGFHFDAGVRALEDAGIILPLLKDLGIRLEVLPSPVSLGIEDRILRLGGADSLAEYSAFLKRFYPASAAGIDKLTAIIARIMRHMDVLYGIENPVFKDLSRDRQFIFQRLLPWLPRFLLTIGKINRLQTPVEDYLPGVIHDRSLRDIICQHFFRNTPSFFALSYFSLYLDYFYPKGGVGKLAAALAGKVRELGAEIRTETTITGVAAATHTLTDAANNCYKYRRLVWAADLKTLYRSADVSGLPSEAQARFAAARDSLLKHRGGESVFTLFLQVDEPLSSFAATATGHFFYTPSRQGLGDTHRGDLQALLSDFERVGRQGVWGWLDRFIALNTFEISIPGLKDPDLAPPGQTGVIVSFLADYELFCKVQEAGWAAEFVAGIEDRLISVLAQSVYPMLRDKVIGRFSFSPLSIFDRIGSSEGAIVGWEFQKDMPVVNQIQKAARAVLTPLPGVYQAGQWAYSPAGVPMSILTGKLAANRILKARL